MQLKQKREYITSKTFKAPLLISSTGIIYFVKDRVACETMRNFPNLHDKPPLTCHFKASLNVGTTVSSICLMVMKIQF